jgi:hypothetical protein
MAARRDASVTPGTSGQPLDVTQTLARVAQWLHVDMAGLFSLSSVPPAWFLANGHAPGHSPHYATISQSRTPERSFRDCGVFLMVCQSTMFHPVGVGDNTESLWS